MKKIQFSDPFSNVPTGILLYVTKAPTLGTHKTYCHIKTTFETSSSTNKQA
jgi:hypothetical protein